MSFAVFVSLIDFLSMLDSGYLPVIEYRSKHVRPCESTFIDPQLEQDACHLALMMQLKGIACLLAPAAKQPLFQGLHFCKIFGLDATKE
jgi:hypothetical protein